MKKKILISVLVLFAGLVIGLFVMIKYIAHKGIPDYNETLHLKGLNNEVKVLRDSFAIPQIYAKNEHDLYMATGYVVAQERMWQMDLIRRATTGRLSEILGKDMVNADILLRSLRIPQKSQQVLKECDTNILKTLEAFAEGVNQYIEQNSDNLPFEFTLLGYKPEKWLPVHSVNLLGYMSWDLSMAKKSEIILHKIKGKISLDRYNDLIPDSSFAGDVIFPDFTKDKKVSDTTFLSAIEIIKENVPQILSGSNNWAVSGAKSTTGKAMLANDMHLSLSIPGIWMQIGQHSETGIDVTGVLLPGQPFIISGHNKNIAWGLTNVMLDDIDFYSETINPENSNQYKFDGQWHDLQVSKEIIKIGKDSILEKDIKFTHRGPVVSEINKVDDAVLSMRWIGNEKSNELRSIYLLNRAENWDNFTDAVKTFVSISQNIVYADIEGNIGLYTCAGIPKRLVRGTSVFPGDTSLYDWKGLVPFDSLPHVYNPPCGYVYSANNKTVDDKYPYYISAWFDLSNRGERINELLLQKDKISLEDMKLIQTDKKSKFHEKLVPMIVKILSKNQELSENEKKALKLLKKWNFILSKESSQALIIETFYMRYTENMFKDELNEDLYKEFLKFDLFPDYVTNLILQGKSTNWCDNVSTEKIETFEDIVNKSFKETVEILNKKYGNNLSEIKWGTEHKLGLKHPMGKLWYLDLIFNLNRTENEFGGSYHTVAAASYDFDNYFTCVHGSSHRQIYSFADFDKSISVLPTGNSGIPASKHYCDQTKLYVNDNYHHDYFTKEIIEKNAMYCMIFKQ